ncbi:MAG: DUF3465 domain-containing protein [Steroidobacteraceae bacterium]
MKKLLSLVAALVVGYLLASGGGWTGGGQTTASTSSVDSGESTPRSTSGSRDGGSLQSAFERRQSNIQVESAGEVSRVLADDTDGSRHQRIILRLPSGQTVLIAHNIDLAPRVEGLRPGDRVAFYGEYEWNPQGGVVHWTHRDPSGRHVAGWLEAGGRRYQ